jgi:hypothetical protein
LIRKARIEEVEKRAEFLERGFVALMKIAAETPTAAPKPPKLGPLTSVGWRIRQLGKERLAALGRIERLEKELRETAQWLADQGPTGGKVAEALKKTLEGEEGDGEKPERLAPPPRPWTYYDAPDPWSEFAAWENWLRSHLKGSTETLSGDLLDAIDEIETASKVYLYALCCDLWDREIPITGSGAEDEEPTSEEG